MSEQDLPQHVRVAVIGTGFAGIGMAVGLKRAGEEDFVLLERADDLGGTWRDNSYPGCACDVPSHLYSFSFAPNPDWSRVFSPQPEIHAYMRATAERFGVLPHVRYGAEMLRCDWDDARQRWTVTTSRGAFTADAVVSGHGPLAEPVVPDLPGLEDFEGETWHSARWRHDVDLTGRRVAVIGTGASAIQFVPEIAPQVAHLTLFQRTAPWVVPRFDRAIKDRTKDLYRRRPRTMAATRGAIYWSRELLLKGFLHEGWVRRLQTGLAHRHLAKQVPDPVLRAKVTPHYELGCKRILVSDDYYPALVRDNVEVVTEKAVSVLPHAVVGADGIEHEVDTIIFGTGFHVTDNPIAQRFCGRDGRSLADQWTVGPQAYRGTTVAGFPNLFLLVGPNTGLGHSSIIYMIEAQVEYVLDALRTMRDRGVVSVDVRPAAQEAWNERMQTELAGTVWSTGGCASWYQDSSGRNTTLWPTHTFRFREELKAFDPDAYELRPA
jgi:cation diffusion facilitator CzcD-associated flavoprotein CzcO